MWRCVLALLAVAVVAAGPASAQQAPEWHVGSAANALDARGRAIDQSVHLDYLSRVAQSRFSNVDPYRRDWAPERGRTVSVSYPNRYGARISANLWAPNVPFADPVTGEPADGPFPAVVLVNGLGAAEEVYRWAAQSLAESGYVVLTFDPQGQGDSDRSPRPRERYCDPDGEWREPQEAGMRERGDCAGERPPIDNAALVRNVVGAATDHPDWDLVHEEYVKAGPNFVFGALDAAEWLLSDANPWRELVDATRVGVAGHSLGAFGAAVAANADPEERFDAAVAWDGYGFLEDTADPPRFEVAPRVPTMFQASDQADVADPSVQPEPDPRPSTVNARSFRDADVDAALLHLRASTHQEWRYTPYPLTVAISASRDGQVVASHYTLAWFDRYLKGADTEWARGDEAVQRSDALRRLAARTFDASADRTSIGVGSYDPLTGSNVPYTIEGEAVSDHLSLFFPSFAAFEGHRCDTLREGC